eukprot:764508-Hanusia_phi.AAC.3
MEVTCLDERATELKSVDQGLTPSQRDGSSWADRVRTAMCAAASSPAKSVRCRPVLSAGEADAEEFTGL